MFALITSALAVASPSALSQSKVLALRGGMSMGPFNAGNFENSLKVCAALTAAGAMTAKYADIEGTTLTKALSGGVWDTNLMISLVTGVTSTVVYSVGGSSFETAKLTAVLWLATVLLDLKASNFDLATLKDAKLQTGLAVAAAYLAFA